MNLKHYMESTITTSFNRQSASDCLKEKIKRKEQQAKDDTFSLMLEKEMEKLKGTIRPTKAE